MAKPRMTQRDEFENSDSLSDYLADQLMRGRVALFLGAGISQPFGLPGWDQLLVQLYALKGETPSPGHSPEDLAGHFHFTHFNSDPTGFVAAVREALYQGVTVDL